LNIVITGSSGFIGSKVSQLLAEEFPDFSIVGTGRSESLSMKLTSPNFRYVSCDLLGGNIKKFLPQETDIVIHLAGDRRTFVKHDEFTLQMRSNVEMTNSMADYAYLAGARLFLYASTVYVYSGNAAPPFKENCIDIPSDNLGATKLASESLLKARAVAGQFKVVSFRIGTVYGPGASHEQFIPQAIMKLRSPDPVAKFGPADVRRDFVFIDDVARAYVKAVRQMIDKDFDYEVFNVGTEQSTSIREVVHILAQAIGTGKQIEFGTFKNIGSKADTDHQLDTARIRSALGWYPLISVQEGLKRTLAAFQ
jgi:nucleoside-diphosphate-sugar epimerase